VFDVSVPIHESHEEEEEEEEDIYSTQSDVQHSVHFYFKEMLLFLHMN